MNHHTFRPAAATLDRPGRRSAVGTVIVGVAVAVLALASVAACGSSRSTSGPSSVRSTTRATIASVTSTRSLTSSRPVAGSSTAAPASPHSSSAGSTSPRSSSAKTVGSTAAKPTPTTASSAHPVIVLDPGHSPTLHAIDPATGLDVSDYANEPEMRDVYAVAELVKKRLEADGYRVVMTKSNVMAKVSLAQRAAIANNAHAALALSIHDQAGAIGGIGFGSGNNTVYYQSLGTYRATASGHRVVFTDRHLATLSRAYGRIFATRRTRDEGHHVTLLSNVGYDLGTRGLAPGNIWMVQLLSRVPWVYNEAGGNSPGRSGLDAHDEQRYADGLIDSVERCVPIA